MAVFLTKLGEYYNHIFFELQDEKVKNLYLMNSPLPLFAIISVYYYFIYYGGRKMMENRKPFNLEKPLVVFNAIQILANGYLCLMSIRLYYTFRKSKNGIFCMILTDLEPEEALEAKFATYWYAMLKISDLMDTVFMVLRKNYHQISVLHVYHHLLMVIATWLACKYFTSVGQQIMIGMINVWIHVIMYAYYLVSAKYSSVKNILWLKKMITQMQLAQFMFLLIHQASPFFMPECPHPRILLIFYLIQNCTMITLFANFYYQAYYVAPRKRAKAKLIRKDTNNNNNIDAKKS